MIEERDQTPFPLDGGRVGDGGETLSAKPMHRTGAVARARYLRREQTLPEKLLWADLRKMKLNVRRQTPLGRFTVDFLHHESRLIIEVDGPIHDAPEAREHDRARTDWLKSQGFRVLRYSNKQVTDDRESVLAEIHSAITSPPSQPFPHQGGRALWRVRHQWTRDDEN